MVNVQEASDLNDNVRISARRFEESPYIAKYDSPDLVRGVYAGRYFPISLGENPIEKYWTLRRKALLFDVPEKPVEISGPDAATFLEKVCARHISTLKIGRGRYAVACTPQGGVFMDGVVFRLGEDRFWYVQADGAFETWLIAHSGGFNVTISDPRSRVLQIQGPASMAIMQEASNGAIDEGMKYFHSGEFEVCGQSVYVSRTGFTNELGYEIYDSPEIDHLRLWDDLIKVGQRHGMEVSSTAAMTVRRIEGGILGNLTDMDMTMTPFEAGLAPFVDMDNETFVGRDALAEADRRPLLLGLMCESGTPLRGDTVVDDGRVVGHMTAGVQSPTLGCGVGYVRFIHPDAWVGRTLQLCKTDGSAHSCKIVDLPFFDREKRIVRGLDQTIP